MGINLRDYINDVEELLTEEEAERIFEAAGYVKVSNHEAEEPVYRDCNGEKIISGSKFIYNFRSEFSKRGHVRLENGEFWLFWDDGKYNSSMKDFWTHGYDEEFTKVIGNIWD